MTRNHDQTYEGVIKLAKDKDHMAAKFLLKQAARYLSQGMPPVEPLNSYLIDCLAQISQGEDANKAFNLNKKNSRKKETRRDYEIALRYWAWIRKKGEVYRKWIKDELVEEYGISRGQISRIIKSQGDAPRHYIEHLEKLFGRPVEPTELRPPPTTCKK